MGTELVDWLMNLSVIVHTRAQAAGMWQAIFEEGVLCHGEPSAFLKFLNFFSPIFSAVILLQIRLAVD